MKIVLSRVTVDADDAGPCEWTIALCPRPDWIPGRGALELQCSRPSGHGVLSVGINCDAGARVLAAAVQKIVSLVKVM